MPDYGTIVIGAGGLTAVIVPSLESQKYLCGASTLSHGVSGATASGLATAKAILHCSSSGLLTQGGPPLQIYPLEDIRQWPEHLQRRIERGQGVS